MRYNIRRIITVTFLLISLIFVIILGYTTYLYFRVYATIRNFNVTIPTLTVNVGENSYVKIETPITLYNPSEMSLELIQILESLWLEGNYVSRGSLSWQNPIEIRPRSTVNVTITAEVPSNKIQYVITQLDEDWIVYTRIFLKVPLVGVFSWQNTWLIQDITRV